MTYNNFAALSVEDKLWVLHERASHNDTCIDDVRADVERVRGDLRNMGIWMRWGVGLAFTVLLAIGGLYSQMQSLVANLVIRH